MPRSPTELKRNGPPPSNPKSRSRRSITSTARLASSSRSRREAAHQERSRKEKSKVRSNPISVPEPISSVAKPSQSQKLELHQGLDTISTASLSTRNRSRSSCPTSATRCSTSVSSRVESSWAVSKPSGSHEDSPDITPSRDLGVIPACAPWSALLAVGDDMESVAETETAYIPSPVEAMDEATFKPLPTRRQMSKLVQRSLDESSPSSDTLTRSHAKSELNPPMDKSFVEKTRTSRRYSLASASFSSPRQANALVFQADRMPSLSRGNQQREWSTVPLKKRPVVLPVEEDTEQRHHSKPSDSVSPSEFRSRSPIRQRVSSSGGRVRRAQSHQMSGAVDASLLSTDADSSSRAVVSSKPKNLLSRAEKLLKELEIDMVEQSPALVVEDDTSPRACFSRKSKTAASAVWLGSASVPVPASTGTTRQSSATRSHPSSSRGVSKPKRFRQRRQVLPQKRRLLDQATRSVDRSAQVQAKPFSKVGASVRDSVLRQRESPGSPAATSDASVPVVQPETPRRRRLSTSPELSTSTGCFGGAPHASASPSISRHQERQSADEAKTSRPHKSAFRTPTRRSGSQEGSARSPLVSQDIISEDLIEPMSPELGYMSPQRSQERSRPVIKGGKDPTPSPPDHGSNKSHTSRGIERPALAPSEAAFSRLNAGNQLVQGAVIAADAERNTASRKPSGVRSVETRGKCAERSRSVNLSGSVVPLRKKRSRLRVKLGMRKRSSGKGKNSVLNQHDGPSREPLKSPVKIVSKPASAIAKGCGLDASDDDDYSSLSSPAKRMIISTSANLSSPETQKPVYRIEETSLLSSGDKRPKRHLKLPLRLRSLSPTEQHLSIDRQKSKQPPTYKWNPKRTICTNLQARERPKSPSDGHGRNATSTKGPKSSAAFSHRSPVKSGCSVITVFPLGYSARRSLHLARDHAWRSRKSHVWPRYRASAFKKRLAPAQLRQARIVLQPLSLDRLPTHNEGSLSRKVSQQELTSGAGSFMKQEQKIVSEVHATDLLPASMKEVLTYDEPPQPERVVVSDLKQIGYVSHSGSSGGKWVQQGLASDDRIGSAMGTNRKEPPEVPRPVEQDTMLERMLLQQDGTRTDTAPPHLDNIPTKEFLVPETTTALLPPSRMSSRARKPSARVLQSQENSNALVFGRKPLESNRSQMPMPVPREMPVSAASEDLSSKRVSPKLSPPSTASLASKPRKHKLLQLSAKFLGKPKTKGLQQADGPDDLGEANLVTNLAGASSVGKMLDGNPRSSQDKVQTLPVKALTADSSLSPVGLANATTEGGLSADPSYRPKIQCVTVHPTATGGFDMDVDIALSEEMAGDTNEGIGDQDAGHMDEGQDKRSSAADQTPDGAMELLDRGLVSLVPSLLLQRLTTISPTDLVATSSGSLSIGENREAVQEDLFNEDDISGIQREGDDEEKQQCSTVTSSALGKGIVIVDEERPSRGIIRVSPRKKLQNRDRSPLVQDESDVAIAAAVMQDVLTIVCGKMDKYNQDLLGIVGDFLEATPWSSPKPFTLQRTRIYPTKIVEYPSHADQTSDMLASPMKTRRQSLGLIRKGVGDGYSTGSRGTTNVKSVTNMRGLSKRAASSNLMQKGRHRVPQSQSSIRARSLLSTAKRGPQLASSSMPEMCRHCGATLSSIWNLRRHEVSFHTPGVFRCMKCSDFYDTKYMLNCHYLKSHTAAAPLPAAPSTVPIPKGASNGKRFVCKHCHYRYNTLSSLRQHIDSIHTLKKCDKCGATLSTLRNLRRHEATVHARGGFPSSDRVATKVQVKSHSAGSKKTVAAPTPVRFKVPSPHVTKSSGAAVDSYMFTCEHCDRSFTALDFLQTHVASRHTPRTCRKCGTVLANTGCLRKHERVLHTRGVFPCTKCFERFATKYQMNCHLRQAHPTAKPRTLLPGPGRASVSGSSGLSFRPIRLPGYDKDVYDCVHCGRHFNEERYLIYHINVLHTPRACDACGETFMEIKSLLLHRIDEHDDYDPLLSCGINGCRFVGNKASDVAKHRLYLSTPHSRETVYKLFDSKTNPAGGGSLTSSKQQSDGAAGAKASPGRSSRCPDCGRRFKSDSGLRRHIATEHEDYWSMCSRCGAEFTAEASLMDHIKSKCRNLDRCSYKCSFCKEEFDSQPDWAFHVEGVHLVGPASYLCDRCLQTFPTDAQLQAHRSTTDCTKGPGADDLSKSRGVGERGKFHTRMMSPRSYVTIVGDGELTDELPDENFLSELQAMVEQSDDTIWG